MRKDKYEAEYRRNKNDEVVSVVVDRVSGAVVVGPFPHYYIASDLARSLNFISSQMERKDLEEIKPL